MSEPAADAPVGERETSAAASSPLTANETVRAVSGGAQALVDFGLRLEDGPWMSAGAVEQVLITDEWGCDVCGRSKLAVCPATGRPHRRRLVRIAQEMLRLVGRCVGRAYARPAKLADRMGGVVRVRTERHMAVNPQLLLLAFHFAAGDGGGSGGLVVECARHVLDLLRQLRLYGSRAIADMDETYSRALLESFHSAWREYLRAATREIAVRDPAAERAAAAELFAGTRAALLAATAASVRDPADADLKAFCALLFQRIGRLATREQRVEVEAEVRDVERRGGRTVAAAVAKPMSADALLAGALAAAPSTPPAASPSSTAVTPRIRRSNPPLMPSDLNTTSGSEVDALPPAAAARALGLVDGRPQLGPPLPPDWYVDATGRSRPRPGLEERKRRERYLQLEFRARKAYEAVMNVKPPESEGERQRAALVAAVGEAQLLELARQLNLPEPQYTMLPTLLQAVESALVEALPRRFRPQLEQEFRDALDWNVLARRAANGQAALSGALRLVMQKVLQYGAPEREAATREAMERVGADLDAHRPDLGTAVANAFRCLFSSIKTLREDVARYSLLLVSSQLRGNALEYIRSFVDACLPAPAQWASSLAFLRRYVNQTVVRDWATSAEGAALVLLCPDERRVRGAVLFGLVDLLRSGTHTPANRWDQLPAEIFYFEKSYIFSGANTVQECTLLLLLEGTVSAILAGKRCTHAQVAETLRRLHSRILSLLADDIKLSALKLAVADFLDDALEGLFPPPAVAPQLSETERAVLSGTVDKMADTESVLYTTFETKVVKLMASVIRGDPNPAPLGLVTEDARRQATLLSKLIAFNYEVYRPYYEALIPLLDIQD